MSKQKINELSKWLQRLWLIYQKTLIGEMTVEDYQELLKECEAVWIESGKDDRVMDMSMVFLEDAERRAAYA